MCVYIPLFFALSIISIQTLASHIMKSNKNSPQNPNCSIKARLASRFLRAMKRLKSNTSSNKRCHAIRAAAYASMASVVGRNRAWSRAVLRKIKNRQRAVKERKCSPHHRGNRSRNYPTRSETDLRQLVPGGEALDFGRLLNESSDYIKCLKAQVEVMRKILEYSSKFRF